MLAQYQSRVRNINMRRDNAELLLSSLGDAAKFAVNNLSEHDTTLKLVLTLPDELPEAGDCLEMFREVGIECEVGYQPLHLKCQTSSTNHPIHTEKIWTRVLCIPIEKAYKYPSRLRNILPSLNDKQFEQSHRPQEFAGTNRKVNHHAGVDPGSESKVTPA